MTIETCSYKGRPYRLVWRGKTKFGRRARLEFMDGSKEFWVAEEAIDLVDVPRRSAYSSRPRRRPTCPTCLDMHDGGTICPDCGQEDWF